jgi:hypothetical protein
MKVETILMHTHATNHLCNSQSKTNTNNKHIVFS